MLAVRQEAAWPCRASSGLFLGQAGGRRCPRGQGEPRNGPETGLLLAISDLSPRANLFKTCVAFNELAGWKTTHGATGVCLQRGVG